VGHEVVGVTVAVGMLAGYEEKARQRMYDACLVHEATYEGGVARRRPRSRGGRRSLGTLRGIPEFRVAFTSASRGSGIPAPLAVLSLVAGGEAGRAVTGSIIKPKVTARRCTG